MAKKFNVTADCKPDRHYMVNLDRRLAEIKELIDDGAYFTINRARQYGKTTTLRTLYWYLQKEYYVVLLDFQMFGAEEFADENNAKLKEMIKADILSTQEQIKTIKENLGNSSDIITRDINNNISYIYLESVSSDDKISNFLLIFFHFTNF